MKKFLTKSILFSLIFFGIGIIAIFITKATLLTANTGDKLTASKRNDVINEINSLRTTVSAINSIPAGSIVAFNASSCPTGRKASDGTNSTVDLRGEFIRGLDSGRGIDSGRTLGSLQRGSLVMNNYSNTDLRVFNLITFGSGDKRLGYDLPITDPSVLYYRTQAAGASVTTTTRGGNGWVDKEYVGMTRPRNVALLYCVKQ